MATRGYDGATTPVVERFTKEQRQRLEALTFGRKLLEYRAGKDDIEQWLTLADYIVKGAR